MTEADSEIIRPEERKSFDEKFVRMDTKRLCEFTSAADSLQLVDLTSRALEGKSPEDIFHLPDDLTEEEKLEPTMDDPRIRLLKELKERERLKDVELEEEHGDDLLSFINGDYKGARTSKNKKKNRKRKDHAPSNSTSSSNNAVNMNKKAHYHESNELDSACSNPAAVFPGRRTKILELLNLLGPLNSPITPLFIYGSASTGKTSIILEIFKHLNRPFTYCSFITCYNPRLLFESILNQLLLLHRKNESNTTKRCEKPSDFVNLLREALTVLIGSLIGKSKGKMVYLIFDNLELVREWDKSSTILPLLFNLYDILKMPEVGIIFVSKSSPDTFQSDTGYAEPFPVYFPNYTEDDLRHIFMKNQANPKLYSSFLDLVLRPFCRITRRVDELSTAFLPLFNKYCEPIGGDLGTVPSEDMKRKLFSHIQPFISRTLNETFSVPSSVNKDGTMRKSITKKRGVSETLYVIDFHMSTCAKYLLISAFLASRNPATLDASLFDSTGGSDNRKKRRKCSEKAKEQKETKEDELLMKGPGSFPLERLLAIFQCITEYTPNDEELENGGLMSDILLQLSSLCSANFIAKGQSCPLEGSTRYRSTVSEDMALKVSRSLKFPLSKYLFRG